MRYMRYYVPSIKVSHLKTDKGNSATNQVVVKTRNNTRFYSYGSLVAVKDTRSHKVYIDPDYYKYSRTTSKYLGRFLGLSSKEIERRIEGTTFPASIQLRLLSPE